MSIELIAAFEKAREKKRKKQQQEVPSISNCTSFFFSSLSYPLLLSLSLHIDIIFSFFFFSLPFFESSFKIVSSFFLLSLSPIISPFSFSLSLSLTLFLSISLSYTH